MRINFVMSNTVSSGIFNAIIGYFKKYLPGNTELFITQYPVKNADIYHYHRPNLETELLPNSVVTVHHDLEDTDPWFSASEFIDKYHQADRIVCLNTLQKNFLSQTESLENTIVIPHGINEQLFKDSKRSYLNGKLTLGIVSKRYERRVKGEALLSELYKRLNVDSIAFCFVGEGRTKDMLDAQEYGFEAVSYEKLPYHMYGQLYQSLDILLVPSLFEGGPANIPEAIYTRTPIVGRKIAMIADMIEESKNGYFLTGDPDVDADLINRLSLNHDGIYNTLIDSVNSYTPAVMTWREVVEEHFKLYEEIVSSSNDENKDQDEN